MKLTICVITARKNPQLDWMADSLRRQLARKEKPQIIVVDYWAQAMPLENWSDADAAERRGQITVEIGNGFDVKVTPPKPTIWQGPHRVTKQNWWAIANARNTGICLAEREFVSFLDDRLVLSNHWLQSVRLAIKGKYVVAGAYEKRWYMSVGHGQIESPGKVDGTDNRVALAASKVAAPCKGQWLYGGNFGLPLEWILAVNGVEEMMDSLSFEDVIFGEVLQNNGYPIKYDPRMKIIEDRTPELLDTPFRREDKGPIGTPEDKSHESLRRFATLKRAAHPWDIRAMRETALKGGPWPSVDAFPKVDWFDGQPITEL